MSDETDCPVVVLASGQMLKLRKIMLYDEDAVLAVAALRAHAAKGLGSTGGSGLGILGTPSFEFAAEAVGLMLVSGLFASAVQKTAMEFLKMAQERHEWLSDHGVYFESNLIRNAHVPRPGAWSALGPTTERQIPIERLSKIEQDALLRKYNKSTRDLTNGKLQFTAQPRYVHNGDDFIFVATDIGNMSVRWSHVAAYWATRQ
jgi:hypothetical protein